MSFNQTDALLSLSYLLGERSVPTAETAARQDFVQTTLQEAYTAYPWRFATRTATVAIVNNIATLPTNVDISHELYAKYYVGSNEISLSQIDLNDIATAYDGSHQYWLTKEDDSAPYVLNTKDSASIASIKYQTLAPTIAATVVTPYPSKGTIALGARRYVKLSQNPDADISQDETLFQNRLSQDIAAHQVAAPRAKRQSRQSVYGRRTGDF